MTQDARKLIEAQSRETGELRAATLARQRAHAELASLHREREVSARTRDRARRQHAIALGRVLLRANPYHHLRLANVFQSALA